MKSLFLIQHCQSHHHVNHEAKFWPDVRNGLTDLGQRQAELVAARLREMIGDSPSRIYTSKMQRSVETAEILGHEFGVDPQAIDGLHENNGHFAMERNENGEGWQIDRSNWSLFDWRPFPEAETWREFHARVCAAMNEIEDMHPDGAIPIVVLHGGSLSNAVVWWLRLELDAMPERTCFAAQPASISVLAKTKFGNPVIERLNDTSHLPEDLRGGRRNYLE